METVGLIETEVRESVSSVEMNSGENAASRTYFDIITKNVFTVFNLILFTLGALLLYCKELTSALAATGIIVMNILIATIQEIRAKRRLDRIAVLMRPKVMVVRDSVETEIDQAKIVKDDIIHLRSGDQALVDGELLNVRSIEMDESLLTGESSTVRKKECDAIYSGSYCVTGEGYYRVTAFGEETFAAKMLASAKRFNNKHSPLQMETGAITKLLMLVAMAYLSVMVILNVAIPGGGGMNTVANLKMAVIIMDIVPIALFLMIVIAYMIAAVRMSDSGILLQRSNSVESMSHVDTVCMDKTGTITTNRLVYREMTPFVSIEEAERYAKMFANATGSRNRTVDALLNRFGEMDTELIDEIMFSSERKFSGVRIYDGGETVTLIMGAYDTLIKSMDDHGDLRGIVDNYSSMGLRTVILAKAKEHLDFYVDDVAVLPPLEPLAALAIEDEIRPDCRETMERFLENDMEIRILSGDDPVAVDALFRIAGLPGERTILSGDELDALDEDERTRRILETNIFGRMRPDQKELVIEELKISGRYVAMIGDGVNDVRSLKEAQVGIALQSGSGAARGVADMVLMSDDFSALPKALVEGNRTVSGMRDILKVYLARNFVIAMMVFLIAVIFQAPPLVPVTSAFYAFISLSIAAFFMIIWAKPSKLEGSILPDVLKFAIPTALLVSLFGLITYCMFYLGGYHDMFGIVMTDDQLNTFWWAGGDISVITAASDGEKLKMMSEVLGRNALLVFLMLAGMVQVMMVVPRFRFFSVDGRVNGDAKPTILVLLLFGLMALAYWAMWKYEIAAEVFTIYILPWYAYAIIALLIVIWFFITRWVLRNGFLERFTNLTEWMYSRQLKNVRKKRDREGHQ